MANFYTIKPSGEAEQWRVGMSRNFDSKVGFFKQYEHSIDKLWDVIYPIELLLWFRYLDNENYRDLGFADIISWRGDVMQDPEMLGGPVATYKIVSEKLKTVLEKFNSFTRKIHSINVFKPDSNENRKYFAIQLIDQTLDKINYSESQFCIKKRREITRIYEKGDIKDKAEFLGKLNSLDRRSLLKIISVSFNINFDIISSFEGEILISEKVKQALEQLDLVGVEFKKFDKYEIVMPEEII